MALPGERRVYESDNIVGSAAHGTADFISRPFRRESRRFTGGVLLGVTIGTGLLLTGVAGAVGYFGKNASEVAENTGSNSDIVIPCVKKFGYDCGSEGSRSESSGDKSGPEQDNVRPGDQVSQPDSASAPATYAEPDSSGVRIEEFTVNDSIIGAWSLVRQACGIENNNGQVVQTLKNSGIANGAQFTQDQVITVHCAN